MKKSYNRNRLAVVTGELIALTANSETRPPDTHIAKIQTVTAVAGLHHAGMPDDDVRRFIVHEIAGEPGHINPSTYAECETLFDDRHRADERRTTGSYRVVPRLDDDLQEKYRC